MIESIYLKVLRNTEFLQFLKDVSAIVKKQGAKDLNVEAQWKALQRSVDQLEGLIQQDGALDLTEVVAALDDRRDEALTGIISFVESMTNHFDPAKRSAAKALKADVDRYGSGLPRLNYQAETSVISSICDNWESKPGLKEKVEMLGLTDWLKELKTANKLFNEKYLERIKAEANAPDVQDRKSVV